jgi:hypothetical protein
MNATLSHVVLGVVGAVSLDVMADIDRIDKKLILQGVVTGVALGAIYTVFGSAATIGAVCMAICVQLKSGPRYNRSDLARQRMAALFSGTIVGSIFGRLAGIRY